MAAVLILCACSTPQVALDQANHGVRLIQNLQTELVRYQDSVKLSAQRRLRSIEAQDDVTADSARKQQFDAYVDAKAGNGEVLAARDRLREASDTYTRLIAEDDKARAALAARLAGLTKDLPTPTEKLGALQKAMAELGTELSAKERVAIVTKFLKQAKCIVDKGKAEAAAAASAPAAAATAPTGCTTTDQTTQEKA